MNLLLQNEEATQIIVLLSGLERVTLKAKDMVEQRTAACVALVGAVST